MSGPRIENLRLENWQEVTVEERRQALQDLENALAVQEGRDSCTVMLIRDDQYEFFEDRITTRGVHSNGKIYINEALVNPDKSYRAIYTDGTEINPDEPYMATETLFHESRHAYQEHITSHPEQSNDPQWLKDFRMNMDKDGYLAQEDFGDEYYRWQPIEKDANDAARMRTNELYAVEFKDSSRYPIHHQQMYNELKDDINYAEIQIGPDYEEKARSKMIETYNESKSQKLTEDISKDTTSAGEDYDYYYGYGL